MNNKDDLKKELKEKKRDFNKAKEHAHKTLVRESAKIARKKEEKLEEEDKKLKKELQNLRGKRKKFLDKIEKNFAKVTKTFDKKAEEAVAEKEKEHKKIHREAETAKHQVEELSKKEIAAARKEFISVQKRVYSKRRKIINALQFIFVLYLFILSVIVLKNVAIELSNGTIQAITSTVDTPLSAFGAGWFGAIIAQSASVIAILANTLAGTGVIDFGSAFYILLGLTLGNAVTPVVASLIIKTDERWHLRHGFELGLANVIYSFFLVIIVMIVELTTHLFTSSGDAIASWTGSIRTFQAIPDLLSVITDPLLNLIHFDKWPLVISFIFGLFILIFSLGKVGKSMFVFMGGKRHTRAIMEKYLSTHWRAFGIGLGLTIIIPSASLLVTLMVPLAIARVVTLRQAIPYIIGTSVGTFIDVLLASFANAQGYSVAGGIVLTMMSSLGILFIFKNFGSRMVYKITRYLTLHVIKMRRTNILKYLAGFILIPALITIIF